MSLLSQHLIIQPRMVAIFIVATQRALAQHISGILLCMVIWSRQPQMPLLRLMMAQDIHQSQQHKKRACEGSFLLAPESQLICIDRLFGDQLNEQNNKRRTEADDSGCNNI